MPFRDHHRFTETDVKRMTDAAREANAAAILVTEKDAVRLDPRLLDDPPAARVPLRVVVEPPAFVDWMLERLRDARGPAVERGRDQRL